MIESLDSARGACWEETTSKLDLSKSNPSRLGAAVHPPAKSHPPVTTNKIATHLLKVASGQSSS